MPCNTHMLDSVGWQQDCKSSGLPTTGRGTGIGLGLDGQIVFMDSMYEQRMHGPNLVNIDIILLSVFTAIFTTAKSSESIGLS